MKQMRTRFQTQCPKDHPGTDYPQSVRVPTPEAALAREIAAGGTCGQVSCGLLVDHVHTYEVRLRGMLVRS